MRWLRHIALAFVLAFAWTAPVAFLPTAAIAQPATDANGGYEARAVGVLQASVGTSWTDYTYLNFAFASTNAATANSYLVSLTIYNTHATQTLYVLLFSGGVTATSDALPVAAGAALKLPGIMGTVTSTISLRGSGASTTADIVGYWW